MITKDMWSEDLHDNERTKEYFDLCSKITDGFGEYHHILPKSVWPQFVNCSWNIVKLSYEDHYKAHEMLVLIAKTENCKQKMLYAWNRVRNTRKGLVTTSDEYANLRLQHRQMLSSKMSGKSNPMFGKVGSQCPFFGKKHTPETLARLSESHYGHKASQRTKDIMSSQKIGENNWMYGKTHSDQTKDLIRSRKSSYTYHQYDLSGNFVRSWSRLELDNSEFCAQNVHAVCQGKVKTHKGFVWKKEPKSKLTPETETS